MTSLFCALAMMPATTVELTPTDDVWVYPFAQDQTSDDFIRCWGDSEGAVGKVSEGHFAFSYSCIKFDLDKIPQGKVISAKLILTSVSNPAYTLEDCKKYPVEARRLAANFEEENWDFKMATKVCPEAGEKEIFGSGETDDFQPDKPVVFTIDLTKGKGEFLKNLDEARKSSAKVMSMAITSKMNPDVAGEGRTYKFFSRTYEKKEVRPKLVVVVE